MKRGGVRENEALCGGLFVYTCRFARVYNNNLNTHTHTHNLTHTHTPSHTLIHPHTPHRAVVEFHKGATRIPPVVIHVCSGSDCITIRYVGDCIWYVVECTCIVYCWGGGWVLIHIITYAHMTHTRHMHT